MFDLIWSYNQKPQRKIFFWGYICRSFYLMGLIVQRIGSLNLVERNLWDKNKDSRNLWGRKVKINYTGRVRKYLLSLHHFIDNIGSVQEHCLNCFAVLQYHLVVLFYVFDNFDIPLVRYPLVAAVF